MVAHALDVLDGEFVVGPEGQQGQLVSDGANVAPRPCVVLPLARSR